MFSSKLKLRVLDTTILLLLVTATLMVTAKTLSAKATPEKENPISANENSFVDLNYLVEHLEEYEGIYVTTNGTARYYASIYMFEDFWLQAHDDDNSKIPVVTRFAGLTVPPNMTEVEVSGTVEYSALEGGFHYLNASSWNTTPAEAPTPTSTPTPTPTPSSSPNQSPSPSPSSSPNPTTTPTSSQSELSATTAVLAVVAAACTIGVSAILLRKKR